MKFLFVLQKLFGVFLSIILVGEFLVDASTLNDGCPKISLTNGLVRFGGRKYSRLARFSCKKGFQLIGEKFAICRNGDWDLGSAYCAKSGCRNFPELSNGMQFYMKDYSYILFFCNPNYQLVGSSKAYCDGVNWNVSQPRCISNKSETVSFCDFENIDLCGWVQDPKHDFDWIRQNSKTPSGHIGTGPSFDHTLGEGKLGYYMYIESSSRVENDTARLLSPIYSSTLSRNGCFVFYYHMYGRTIGTLRVFVHPENLDFNTIINDSLQRQKYTMFEKKGNQGNFWYRGFFDLDEMENNFQIIIEGVRGPGYVSDIAIDDVKILQAEQCVEIKTEQLAATSMPIIETDSCLNRCFISTNDETTKKDALWFFGNRKESVNCQCTYECILMNSCCVDYRDLCLYTYTNIRTTSTDDLLSTADETTNQPQILPTPLKTTATKIPIPEEFTTDNIDEQETTHEKTSARPKTTTTQRTTSTTPTKKQTPKATISSTMLPVVKKLVTPELALKSTIPIQNNQSAKTTSREAVPISFTNYTMYDVIRLDVTTVTTESDELESTQYKTTTTTQATQTYSKHYGHYGRDDNGNVKDAVEIIPTTNNINSEKKLSYRQDAHIGDGEDPAPKPLSVTSIMLILIVIVFVISTGTVIKLGVARQLYSRASTGFVTLRQRWTRTNSLSSSQPDMRFLVQDEELENYID